MLRDQNAAYSDRLQSREPFAVTSDTLRRRSSSNNSSQTCTTATSATAAVAVDAIDAAYRDGMQFGLADTAGSDECLQSEETQRCTYNDDDSAIASVSCMQQHRQPQLQPLLERTATPFHLRWRERDNV
jgi:hypothetical protein